MADPRIDSESKLKLAIAREIAKANFPTEPAIPMGFSDLLTSSRGPGLVGTLLALLVLAGFSTLYVFVFDEGLQGGKKTIEAVIRDQALLIEAHKTQIQDAKRRLDGAARLKAQAREAEELEFRADVSAKRIVELTSIKVDAESLVTVARKQWEAYKDKYRAAERARAVGENLGDIQLASGRLLREVNIRSVDSIGINVRHREGISRMTFRDLPSRIQDRFQFDEEEAAAALHEEEVITGRIANAVSAVEGAASERKLDERIAREMADEEKLKRLRRAMIPERINSLKEEVARLEREIRTEEMRGLRGRIPEIRKSIVRAKIKIESLKKEMESK